MYIFFLSIVNGQNNTLNQTMDLLTFLLLSFISNTQNIFHLKVRSDNHYLADQKNKSCIGVYNK
ncbi:MAG: hypothetical protein JSS70_17985 [Bacteroidetes bacterium]|nr:hypothetical protein [Bacteroidota bacterium]